jgi:hypothetical protein
MTTRETKRFGSSVRRPNLRSSAPKKPRTSPKEAKAAVRSGMNPGTRREHRDGTPT